MEKTIKFGSVAWQEQMKNKIEQDMINGKELDDYERVFLEIQARRGD